MNHLIIPILLAGTFIALSTVEAGAVVCARGVYRAGCVSAGGSRRCRPSRRPSRCACCCGRAAAGCGSPQGVLTVLKRISSKPPVAGRA
jgi:hypothetical protein